MLRILAWSVVVSSLVSGELLLAQEGANDRTVSDLGRQLDAARRQIARLERDFGELEDRVDETQGELPEGFLTLGNEEFRLEGKLEFLFIDTENIQFAPLGAGGTTIEPDPHAFLQRFRLEPEIELDRHLSLRAQLDFRPTSGDTELREATAVHSVRPVWWFRSQFVVGLEDRFAQPDRRTKTHPLVSNAFFRRESLGFVWKLTFGDDEGPPAAGADEEDGRGAGLGRASGPGEEGFDQESIGPAARRQENPFDFLENWGEFELYLSLTQGYRLDTNEVGFDEAPVFDLIQDDRELEDDLSFRELGVGLGYQRSFDSLGELHVLGYLFNDELRDASVEFLRQELTIRDPGGVAIAGYGDSRSTASFRYGARVEYFFPATTILASVYEADPNDGLRILAQWVDARDGELDRVGWYAQASWRWSFGRLLFDRYFRSLEPVVRYGRLESDIGPVPTLPGTWDRTEFLAGAILEVTGDTYLQFEYTWYDAETGAGDVSPSELLVYLLFRF